MKVVEDQTDDFGKRALSANLSDDEDSCELMDIVVVPKHPKYLPVKSVIEAIAASVLLVFLLPIILFFAILVRVTSKGPAFYIQTRLGLNGRTFLMIKLRTMIADAEAQSGAVWAEKNDSRITPLGNFLRKTQIDEFPQLVNVILGQMSLIGPRPERPEIADRLELEIPYYKQRLHVKPGISGLAQLTLPADTDTESVRRKLIPDLFYVKNVSFWLDLRILSFTSVYFVKSLFRFAWSQISLPTVQSAKDSLIREFEVELLRQAPETGTSRSDAKAS